MSTSRIFLNYTDWHDVDEEMRTIPMYGDKWATASGVAGLMYRSLYCSPDAFDNDVASSNIRNVHLLYG